MLYICSFIATLTAATKKLRNMEILKYFFSIFLIIPLINSTNAKCPNSYCGSSLFSIKYPFKLQGQQPQICSDYINLTCTSQDNTVLNLPFSGDFYVSDIIYYTNSISLYDPQDCLAKRFMNLNLSSSSPFAAINHQYYTFYSCPITEKLFSDGFTPIDCLTDLPYTTIANSYMSPGEMKAYGCSTIVTVSLPVEEYGQFDGLGIFSNLRLRWDVPSCKDCEESVSDPQEQEKPRSQLSKYIPLFIFLGLSLGCCMRVVVARNLANATAASATREEVAMTAGTTTTTSATMPPQSAGGGPMTSPDEHYLKTMTISTLLEGNFGPVEAHDQGCSCTICLEEYKPQDTIKCLTLCHHYFHAQCIDQWLQKNSSCPVCRTSILDVNL